MLVGKPGSLMATTIWTMFAVATMAGMFAACVAVVTVGVRMLERVLTARRQTRQS